jgi:cytochrome c oxidase assembly protein subunit 15
MRFSGMMVMLFGQVVLGIITVLYAAPLHAAISHQIGAILLFVLTLRARFGAAYPVAQTIARG